MNIPSARYFNTAEGKRQGAVATGKRIYSDYLGLCPAPFKKLFEKSFLKIFKNFLYPCRIYIPISPRFVSIQ